MTKKLFYYQGSNALNQKQKGSIIADTKQQAHFQLISRGLTHIKLQQNWQFGAKPKNSEISELLNQLATLLQSVIPLKTACKFCNKIVLKLCSTNGLNDCFNPLNLA